MKIEDFHIFSAGCHSVKWFVHLIRWHHKWIWCLQGEMSHSLLHCDRIPWSECSQSIILSVFNRAFPSLKRQDTYEPFHRIRLKKRCKTSQWRLPYKGNVKLCQKLRKKHTRFLGMRYRYHLEDCISLLYEGLEYSSPLHVYRYILRRLDTRFLEIKLEI